MENSEVDEIILANTFISVERIRQAFDFLFGENEQYTMFGDHYIVRVLKNNHGDLQLQIINTEIDKSLSRIIAASELSYANFDILTDVVRWMLEELGYKLT